MVLNHSTLQGLFLRRKKENVEFQRASASLAPPLYYIVLLFLIVASFCALFCAFLRSAKLVDNVNLIRLKALDEIYKIYTLLHLWNPIEKP